VENRTSEAIAKKAKLVMVGGLNCEMGAAGSEGISGIGEQPSKLRM
jgi:hypothetical protein